jgi:hypothetical protein
LTVDPPRAASGKALNRLLSSLALLAMAHATVRNQYGRNDDCKHLDPDGCLHVGPPRSQPAFPI